MIVTCIMNSSDRLSTEIEKQAYSENIFQDEIFLEVGKEYQVFCISFRNGLSVPWYWVCEEGDEYPTPHLGAFFKVVDSAIPADWKFCPTSNNAGDCGFFPEKWAKDSSFMEKLVDEDIDAISYFQSLKKNY